MCRHNPGCTNRVSEHIVGTKGAACIDSGTGWIKGENPYSPPGSPNAYVQEHADLIDSIRNNKGLNEGGRRGPDERLHRPGLQVGSGDEPVEAGPQPRDVRVVQPARGPGPVPGQTKLV